MKIALISCIDGNFKIESEWSNEESAAVAYHQKCAALHNDKSTPFTAKVMLCNENIACVGNYVEVIDHTQVTE